MKITLTKEQLFKPLQRVVGLVERRQTLPILSHVLFSVEEDILSLRATDLEVELVAFEKLNEVSKSFITTLPGRKLMDICRSLPDDALLHFSLEEQQVEIKSGKSRFTLSALPVEEFPTFQSHPAEVESAILSKDVDYFISRTQFAMAQQDVRYFLNGMLWEFEGKKLTVVAADGHRMALVTKNALDKTYESMKYIVPKKCVLELQKLLSEEKDSVMAHFGENIVRFTTENFQLSSKLIDGKYPEYKYFIPKNTAKTMVVDSSSLKEVLTRASVLSNEKSRSIRLELSKNTLKASANNPEREQSEDEITVEYEGESFSVAFNVNYLLDILSVIKESQVKFLFSSQPEEGVLVEPIGIEDNVFVVMPMRL